MNESVQLRDVVNSDLAVFFAQARGTEICEYILTLPDG
jgi:hypothetical protein